MLELLFWLASYLLLGMFIAAIANKISPTSDSSALAFVILCWPIIGVLFVLVFVYSAVKILVDYVF